MIYIFKYSYRVSEAPLCVNCRLELLIALLHGNKSLSQEARDPIYVKGAQGEWGGRRREPHKNLILTRPKLCISLGAWFGLCVKASFSKRGEDGGKDETQ